MAKKTFDHAVIWGGVLYPAGTAVPVEEKPADKKAVAKDDRSAGAKP